MYPISTSVYRISKCIAVFMLFSAFAYTVKGQVSEEFITPVVIEKSSPNSAFGNYEQKIKANSAISKVDYIKIGSLARIQRSGTLPLTIPGRNGKVIAKATHVEYISDTEYKWYGQTDEGRGSVIILCTEGKVTAHISLPDGVYEIYSAPNNLHALHTLDVNQIKDIKCATDNQKEISQSTESTVESATKNARLDPCPTSRPTRVLVLASPAAVATGNNITQTANLAVSQFNSCIYNSGITSGAVLELAGVQNFNFVETPSPNPTLDPLTTDINRLTTDVAAQNLRNQFQADLVVLLTNGNYTNARGAAAAFGPNNNLSYAIVEVNHATNSKTFAHEIGHLYGGYHQDQSATPQYAKGHYIKNALGVVVNCTIMATASNGGSRLLNFSNPNVSVSGRATGTTSDNNNARRVGETFTTLKTFRTDPPYTLAGYIEGPDQVTSPGFRTFEAVYKCGTGSYTFAWATSSDGVNYTPSSTTAETFNYPFSPNSNFTLHVRSTVTSNGQTSVSFKTTIVNIGGARKSSEATNEQVKFDIYPNPTVENASIEYYLPQDSEVVLEMLDYTGRNIKVLAIGKRQAGLHLAQWDATSFATGLYFCRLRAGQFSTTKRLIVNR